MIPDAAKMDLPIAGTRQRRIWRAALVVVPLLGLVALGLPSLGRWLGSEMSVERSKLRIATVVKGDLLREIAVEGRVVAGSHPTLFAPDAGIVSVVVRAGAVVEVGQELARLASPELESALRQERSALGSEEAELARQQIAARQQRLSNGQAVKLREVELEAAERAMNRAERSRELGIVNDVDYEKAQDDLKVAKLRLEQARRSAELENESLDFETSDRSSRVERQRMVVAELERQIDALSIRSPVAGLVSRMHVEDRAAVARAAPLITVVDLSALEIEVAVAESDADEIQPDTPVEVLVAGRSYPARVRSIAPEVQGGRVTGRVEFNAEIPPALKQNQRVQARLRLETHHDVLKLARGPFLEAGGGRQAYRVSGSVAERVPIEIGALSVTEVEIRSGLVPGDEVVVSDTSRFEGAPQVLLR